MCRFAVDMSQQTHCREKALTSDNEENLQNNSYLFPRRIEINREKSRLDIFGCFRKAVLLYLALFLWVYFEQQENENRISEKNRIRISMNFQFLQTILISKVSNVKLQFFLLCSKKSDLDEEEDSFQMQLQSKQVLMKSRCWMLIKHLKHTGEEVLKDNQ